MLRLHLLALCCDISGSLDDSFPAFVMLIQFGSKSLKHGQEWGGIFRSSINLDPIVPPFGACHHRRLRERCWWQKDIFVSLALRLNDMALCTLVSPISANARLPKLNFSRFAVCTRQGGRIQQPIQLNGQVYQESKCCYAA